MNHVSILKELPERFLSELTNYCVTDPSIEKIVLFGSRARGDFNKRSDIDIALYTTNITSSEQNMIEDKILSIPTHLKIDIVFFDRLTKDKLVNNIERNGVILYERTEAV